LPARLEVAWRTNTSRLHATDAVRTVQGQVQHLSHPQPRSIPPARVRSVGPSNHDSTIEVRCCRGPAAAANEVNRANVTARKRAAVPSSRPAPRARVPLFCLLIASLGFVRITSPVPADVRPRVDASALDTQRFELRGRPSRPPLPNSKLPWRQNRKRSVSPTREKVSIEAQTSIVGFSLFSLDELSLVWHTRSWIATTIQGKLPSLPRASAGAELRTEATCHTAEIVELLNIFTADR